MLLPKDDMSDATGCRVYLRSITKGDRDEFLTAMRESTALHEQWIRPPITKGMFGRHLSRQRRDDHISLLAIEASSGAIAGCFNLNQIARGSLLSTSLSYYAVSAFAKRGYMRMGLEQIIEYAIGKLGLHRLEAHIQPQNRRSIALVKSCGFQQEGLSRNYLFIGNAWRDHERWTYLDQRSGLQHPR